MPLKAEEMFLNELLPKEIKGWVAEEDNLYDPQSIFEYIDGAGEVYRAYNFKLLFSRRFKKEKAPDLVADIFDMGDSKDAYGVFTHDLEGEDAHIGQGSTYKGGLLSFWKDRFFVSLYAEEESLDSREALFELGRKVADAIGREGKMPELVSLLPSELHLKNIRYFHNHLILNYHFFVADENILHLDQETEAVLAELKKEDETNILLLIRYPDRERAEKAQASFLNTYMPEAKKTGLIQEEDLKWTSVSQKENFVVVVFNASTGFEAEYLSEMLLGKIFR